MKQIFKKLYKNNKFHQFLFYNFFPILDIKKKLIITIYIIFANINYI